MEPRCLWEALDCRAPFLESKWEPRGLGELEIPELESETGTDTETGGNGLDSSGPGDVCIAQRNCWENVGFLKPWSGTTMKPRDPLPRNTLPS